jgi:putative NADH-flavin reductase
MEDKSMKIALIGATGKAGSRVLNELLSRGHAVTAIVRNPERVPMSDKVTARGVDGSREAIADAVSGHDAVISSARFIDLLPEILLPAILASGVRRYLIVGGAGSLIHPDGIEEVDQPSFPDVAKPNSNKGKELLEGLKATSGLDWTFISPPRFFVAGERTGTFRYGKDHMLMTETGPTSISYEDMAVAIVDELEQPKHLRERITIGY